MKNKPGLRDITRARHLPKAAFANLLVVNCMLRQAADDKRNGWLVTRLPGGSGVEGGIIDSPAGCSGTVIGATLSVSPIVPDLRGSPEHLARWLCCERVSINKMTHGHKSCVSLPRQTKG